MKHLALITLAALAWGCTSDIPMVNLGIDDTYSIYRMQKLKLSPALTGDAYRWSVTGEDGTATIVSTEREYIFLPEDEGLYTLAFDIDEINEEDYDGKAFSLVVHNEGEKRSYKIEIAPPIGKSFASDIARKYGVTYEMLTEDKLV